MVGARRARVGVVDEVSALVLEVFGTPRPKGSYRAIAGKGSALGRAFLVPSDSDEARAALLAWKRAVAVSVPAFTKTLVDTALAVTIEFRLARPAGHFGARGNLKPSAPAFPRWKPDGDKLLRSTLDALKGVAFDDDARIVDMIACKRYADAKPVGATIVIAPMATDSPATSSPKLAAQNERQPSLMGV